MKHLLTLLLVLAFCTCGRAQINDLPTIDDPKDADRIASYTRGFAAAFRLDSLKAYFQEGGKFIDTVTVDNTGDTLIFVFTDGGSAKVGGIKGADGATGPAGSDGLDGADGDPATNYWTELPGGNLVSGSGVNVSINQGSNPSEALEVNGTAVISSNVQAANLIASGVPNSTTGVVGEMYFRNATTGERISGFRGVQDVEGGGFSFSTLFASGYATRLRIKPNGDFGVNTANPTARLNLYSNASSPNNLIRFNSATTNYAFTGGIEMLESSGEFGTASNYGVRTFYDGSANLWRFQTANQTTINEPLTIKRDGVFVGVGTDAPTTALDVNGDVRIRSIPSGSPVGVIGYEADGTIVQGVVSSQPDQWQDNGSGELVNPGRVGVSTTNANNSTLLDVGGGEPKTGIETPIIVGSRTVAGRTGMALENPDAGSSSEVRFGLYNDQDDYLAFTMNSSTKTGTSFGQPLARAGRLFTNQNNSPLLIGTIKPDSPLAFGTSGNQAILIDPTQRVGVNNDSPSATLDVGGSLEVETLRNADEVSLVGYGADGALSNPTATINLPLGLNMMGLSYPGGTATTRQDFGDFYSSTYNTRLLSQDNIGYGFDLRTRVNGNGQLTDAYLRINDRSIFGNATLKGGYLAFNNQWGFRSLNFETSISKYEYGTGSNDWYEAFLDDRPTEESVKVTQTDGTTEWKPYATANRKASTSNLTRSGTSVTTDPTLFHNDIGVGLFRFKIVARIRGTTTATDFRYQIDRVFTLSDFSFTNYTGTTTGVQGFTFTEPVTVTNTTDCQTVVIEGVFHNSQATNDVRFEWGTTGGAGTVTLVRGSFFELEKL